MTAPALDPTAGKNGGVDEVARTITAEVARRYRGVLLSAVAFLVVVAVAPTRVDQATPFGAGGDFQPFPAADGGSSPVSPSTSVPSPRPAPPIDAPPPLVPSTIGSTTTATSTTTSTTSTSSSTTTSTTSTSSTTTSTTTTTPPSGLDPVCDLAGIEC